MERPKRYYIRGINRLEGILNVVEKSLDDYIEGNKISIKLDRIYNKLSKEV